MQASFRLAMRLEGDFWNAYVALLDTMDGAFLIGSIAKGILHDDKLKDRFMRLMQDAISHGLGAVAGVPVTWPEPPHAAPESERSGHA